MKKFSKFIAESSKNPLEAIRKAIIKYAKDKGINGLVIPVLDKDSDGFVLDDSKDYSKDIENIVSKVPGVSINKKKGKIFIEIEE